MEDIEKTAQACGRETAGRITVALIPDAAAHLGRLQARTGLSKTDIVNRALALYGFVEEVRGGHDLIIRDQDTGEGQLVRFL